MPEPPVDTHTLPGGGDSGLDSPRRRPPSGVVLPVAPPTAASAFTAQRRPRDPIRGLAWWLVAVASFVTVTVPFALRGDVDAAHARLQASAAAVAGPDALAGLGWPPLVGLLARLGTVGLTVVAGVLAGSAVWVVGWRLADRGSPLGVRVPVVAAVILAPGLTWGAINAPVAVTVMVLSVLALGGYLRFALDGDTAGGFGAGLLLGLAVLVDLSALVYVVAFAVALPIVAWPRMAGQPGAVRATVAVVLFPPVLALGAWAYLQWVFTGGTGSVLDGIVESTRWSPEVAVEVLVGTLFTPLYWVVGLVLLRRPGTGSVGYLVLPLVLVAARLVGIDNAGAITVTGLVLVAALCIPGDADADERRLVVLAAIAQSLIGVFVVLQRIT